MRVLIRTVNRTEKNNKEETRKSSNESCVNIYAVGRIEEREKERRLSDMRNNANSLSRESSGV